jgi:membrane protein YqaA with SNARE-associated domain
MARKLQDFANETQEHIMRPIRKFKETPQYTYLNSLGLGFWIFLVVTFCLGFIFMFYIQEFVGIVVSGYGLIGIFFLVIILELIVQPVGPDLTLILGTLAGLNGLIVLGVVLLGAYIALYLGYIIGKKIGTPGVERIIGKKAFTKINWSKGGKWFMFIGATTPVPYIPYLVGVWDFNFKDTIKYVVIPRTIRLALVLVLTYYFGVEVLHLSIGS